MRHFREISFRLFVIILPLPLEMLAVLLNSLGRAFQYLSAAITGGLFAMTIGEQKIAEELQNLMDLQKSKENPSSDND